MQVEIDLHEQFGVAATTALVTGRIGVGLGIEEEIEGWRMAQPDELLVIDRKAKKLWLLGVELTHLMEGTYKLFERLAIAKGGPVEVRVLGAYVSSAAIPMSSCGSGGRGCRRRWSGASRRQGWSAGGDRGRADRD